MIALIEAQCQGWEHEQVNSSFIKMLEEVFEDEKFVVYAEEEHLQCIMKKEKYDYDRISTKRVSIVSKFSEDEEVFETSKILFQEIMKNDSDNLTDVIFLSVSIGIISACVCLAKEYPQVRFHLILHSVLEQILEKRIFKRMAKALLGRQKNQIAKLLDSASLSNMDFITYAPLYKKYLKLYLNRASFMKFFFIHHTFNNLEIKKERTVKCKYGDKIEIALYGQAVTDEAIEVIRKFGQDRELSEIVEFRVITSSAHMITKEKNVMLVYNRDITNITASMIDCYIQECNFVLLPYTKLQYQMTASGIFWDAMRNRVPVLSLDSPYAEYYMKKNEIGFLGKNAAQLGRYLKQKRWKTIDYDKNISTFLYSIAEENKKLIREIICTNSVSS